MNSVTVHAWLDWWANPTINLAGEEVTVVITTTDTGWAAHGHLVNAEGLTGEGFALLCDLDPAFTLRFDDQTSIPVTAHLTRTPGHFTLTEHQTPKTGDAQ